MERAWFCSDLTVVNTYPRHSSIMKTRRLREQGDRPVSATFRSRRQRGDSCGLPNILGPMHDEIRSGVAGMRGDAYRDLLTSTSDASDESLARLITDVANADVARDAAELRDILAAEVRLAAGTYDICSDCEEPVSYARLAAYPTAKRCLRCQEVHEGSPAPPARR